tara:strand:- start:289 stop:600 length:312 start_codon:yes stop_codon:yes gene_type:complete
LKTSLTSRQFLFVLESPNKSFSAKGLRFKFVFSKKNLLGFAINKKLGSAVERNRFKRQCRSFFNDLFKNKPFIFLIVFPLKPVNKTHSIKSDFLKLKELIGSA